MKTKVKIPGTVGGVVERLASLEALVTASGWEQAAIIAAWVDPNKGTAHRVMTKSDHDGLSSREFAELGIRGLTSNATVMRYVKVWMNEVGVRPEVNRVVSLPTIPWPPEQKNLGSRATASNIPDLIRTDPAVAAAAADAVASVLPTLPPEVQARVVSAVERLDRQPAPIRLKSEPSLDDEWAGWLNDANDLFVTGASLAERSEQPEVKLGVHAAAAMYVYQGMTERRIDAEFHQLMKDQGIER